MDDMINIHLASISTSNPLYIIESRAPARIRVFEDPVSVYDWLKDRLDIYADDPVEAMNFEMVDQKRLFSSCSFREF